MENVISVDASKDQMEQFGRIHKNVWKAAEILGSESVSGILGSKYFHPVEEKSVFYVFESRAIVKLKAAELQVLADNLEAALLEYKDEGVS